MTIGSLALLALLQVPAPTQELAPGTTYDPAIPTLEEVVGHDFREEITPPDAVVRYMEALAEAAPERTHLFRYAESWEGRPLVVMVIGSADRLARLDEVRADLQRLANPDGLSDADADALIARTPVVTGLFHGIHGTEISSSGAAMAEAYHLLAAQGDPVPLEQRLKERVGWLSQGVPLHAIQIVRYLQNEESIAKQNGRYELLKGSPRRVIRWWI